jgi:hypothetical protein
VKFTCRGVGVTIDPPFNGDAAVVFTAGGTRYCARFGGTEIRNDAQKLKRVKAAPPVACPEP